MSAEFDPYYKWLGIPPQEQPPNHYRLLGLPVFTADPEVIQNAADQRIAHLRSFQVGQRAALAEDLLNQVTAARLCLLRAPEKTAYDDQLRDSLAPAASASTPPASAAPRQSADDDNLNKATLAWWRGTGGMSIPWTIPAVVLGSIVGVLVGYLALYVVKPTGSALDLSVTQRGGKSGQRLAPAAPKSVPSVASAAPSAATNAPTEGSRDVSRNAPLPPPAPFVPIDVPFASVTSPTEKTEKNSDWRDSPEAKALFEAEQDECPDAPAIAEQWWDLAEKTKGADKSNIRARAADWYRRALLQQSGLVRERILRRLQEYYGPPTTPRENLGLFVQAVDGAAGLQEFQIDPRFDVTKSWILSLEVRLPPPRPNPQQFVLWGDDRAAQDVICLGRDGNMLTAMIGDCVAQERHVVIASYNQNAERPWTKITLVYRAEEGAFSLYVNDALVADEKCKVTPALDRPMPIRIAGAAADAQRFPGELRSIALANLP